MEEKGLQKNARHGHLDDRIDEQGFDTAIDFRWYEPPVELRTFVERFWIVEWRDITPFESEQLLRRPYTDFFFTPNSTGIRYALKKKYTYTVKGSGKIAGIRLRPGVWHATRKQLQANDTLSLEELFSTEAVARAQAFLGATDREIIVALEALLASHPFVIDTNVTLIHRALDYIDVHALEFSTQELAAAVGTSMRWLQQVFKDYTGLSLKWYANRVRLIGALEAVRGSSEISWAALAYDLGYSSQQHFIAEFTSTIGQSPQAFIRKIRR